MDNKQLDKFIIERRYQRHPITQDKHKNLLCRIVEYFRIRRKVKAINKALDITLREWQIRYIFQDQAMPLFRSISRIEGKTLAHILFLLLNPFMDGITIHSIHWRKHELSEGIYFDAQTIAKVLFAEDYSDLHRQLFFMKELKKIQDALNTAGIKTNRIIIRRQK